MATAEPVVRTQDRHAPLRGRRPFAWLRRVTNLNKASFTSPSKPLKGNKFHSTRKHDPYPQSSHLHRPPPASSINGVSFCTPATQSIRDDASYLSFEGDSHPGGSGPPLRSNQSGAPTFVTHAETIASIGNQSKAGTAVTNGGISSLDGEGGGQGSTFSSPNASDRSLTTTLTTIQSAAPSTTLNNQAGNLHAHMPGVLNTNVTNFTQPFPTSPAPTTFSAIPAHLQAPPRTYESATANGLSTDNASILTLASSTKRRRRHSLDTDASVRALAPNSLYNASRESLPLSVFSNATDMPPHILPTGRPSVSLSFQGAERASVYSNSAAVPQSERNSYYAAAPASAPGTAMPGATPKSRSGDPTSAANTSSFTNFATGQNADTDGRSVRSGYGPSLLGRESLLGGTSGGKADSLRGFLGDGASVRSVKSGHLGHGRGESVGSLGWGSPLASPVPGSAVRED